MIFDQEPEPVEIRYISKYQDWEEEEIL